MLVASDKQGAQRGHRTSRRPPSGPCGEPPGAAQDVRGSCRFRGPAHEAFGALLPRTHMRMPNRAYRCPVGAWHLGPASCPRKTIHTRVRPSYSRKGRGLRRNHRSIANYPGGSGATTQARRHRGQDPPANGSEGLIRPRRTQNQGFPSERMGANAASDGIRHENRDIFSISAIHVSGGALASGSPRSVRRRALQAGRIPAHPPGHRRRPR